MMIVAAAALMGVAVWMVVPPPMRRQEGRRPPAWSVVPAGIVAVGLVCGISGVVWAVVATAVGGTVFIVVRRQRRRTQTLRGGQEVARATRALAGRVSVGEIPAMALDHVADDVEVLARAKRAQAVGGSVPDALIATARQPGMAGLVPLAAWKPPWTPNSPRPGRLDGSWACCPSSGCSWDISSGRARRSS